MRRAGTITWVGCSRSHDRPRLPRFRPPQLFGVLAYCGRFRLICRGAVASVVRQSGDTMKTSTKTSTMQHATPAAGDDDYTINGWGSTEADYAYFNINKEILPSA